VVGQGYPALEYIVVDGGSTDGSVDILERYKHKLAALIIEPDKGMYHAIQKGFALGTGTIMAWINSDDVLMPKALFTMARLMADIPSADWITGCQCVIDEQGCSVAVAPPRPWSQVAFAQDHRWIQQESTFWRRSLWLKAGGLLSTKWHYAGDYELWHRFFNNAHLYSADVLIGGFRARTKNQASLEHLPDYEQEVAAIQLAQPLPALVAQKVGKAAKREALIRNLKGIGKDALRQRFVQPLLQAPPRIKFNPATQQFYI